MKKIQYQVKTTQYCTYDRWVQNYWSKTYLKNNRSETFNTKCDAVDACLSEKHNKQINKLQAQNKC